MIRRAWVLMLFLGLVAGCRSAGPGASGKRERCGRLHDRLIECKGFSEMVLREFDGKDAFVDACEKEWTQSRKTIDCLEEETCEAFHRCAFGMSERDLRMLESIGTPSSPKTPEANPGSEPPPDPVQEPTMDPVPPV